jgi:Spy/CpxP family protein refolding chaperone
MNDKRKAILLVVVLFALGAGLGAVGAHLWDAHVIASQAHHSAIRDLRDQLHLTPAQAQQFDTLVSDTHAKFHALGTQEHAEWDPKFHALDAQDHAEWDPRYDQLRQQWRAKARAILTPEQQGIFDAFVKKLDEERQKEQQQGQGQGH